MIQELEPELPRPGLLCSQVKCWLSLGAGEAQSCSQLSAGTREAMGLAGGGTQPLDSDPHLGFWLGFTPSSHDPILRHTEQCYCV